MALLVAKLSDLAWLLCCKAVRFMLQFDGFFPLLFLLYLLSSLSHLWQFLNALCSCLLWLPKFFWSDLTPVECTSASLLMSPKAVSPSSASLTRSRSLLPVACCTYTPGCPAGTTNFIFPYKLAPCITGCLQWRSHLLTFQARKLYVAISLTTCVQLVTKSTWVMSQILPRPLDKALPFCCLPLFLSGFPPPGFCYSRSSSIPEAEASFLKSTVNSV